MKTAAPEDAAVCVAEAPGGEKISHDRRLACQENRSNIMNDTALTALASRFVAAPLPAGVASDLCATMHDYPHTRHGTSLLTVEQAKEVLRFVLTDLLNEDWLADVIDDSLDMDWTGRVGAQAIIRACAS
jgi:hypothetical protein